MPFYIVWEFRIIQLDDFIPLGILVVLISGQDNLDLMNGHLHTRLCLFLFKFTLKVQFLQFYSKQLGGKCTGTLVLL